VNSSRRLLSRLKKSLRNDREPVRLSLVKTTRRTTHETYDNRTCYSLRTLKHVRTRANHWNSHARNERKHNRLVSEHHGGHVWHHRLYRPNQGQERFREHSSSQPFAKRININSHGSRFWAPQVVKRSSARCDWGRHLHTSVDHHRRRNLFGRRVDEWKGLPLVDIPC
jgi:hypothetical protein